MFMALFYEYACMAVIHDIILMVLYGSLCLFCAIVVSTPVVWVFSKLWYWVTERRKHHGTKR